ncbi:hypothetical protein DPMN_076156 [Dreissena polymorpha]|uniref:Uncharacterized protein n=1 Tax=Dreissena polymorpha TaxID=45954 RepID=A0A9D3YN66_DREPO|nr:hypothetical protein DPMN_076156 [Dreissena polymorpha]
MRDSALYRSLPCSNLSFSSVSKWSTNGRYILFFQNSDTLLAGAFGRFFWRPAFLGVDGTTSTADAMSPAFSYKASHTVSSVRSF